MNEEQIGITILIVLTFLIAAFLFSLPNPNESNDELL